MTGIFRTPATNPPATNRDQRWKRRQEAWNIAEASLQDLIANDTAELRAAIGRTAATTGFWSVWRVIFARDKKMLGIIDKAFRGTAPDCFNQRTRAPLSRPRGAL